MSLWTCDDCKAVNARAARVCEACGTEKPTAKGYHQQTAGDAGIMRGCSWRQAKPCLMPATWWPTAKAGFCDWHAFGLRGARAIEGYEQFELFVAGLLEARYCCPWTHYPARVTWARCAGQPVIEAKATPCVQGACYLRVPPERTGPVQASIHQLIRELTEGVAIPAPAPGETA